MNRILRLLAPAILLLTAGSLTRGADAPATFKVSTLTFTQPEKWESVPTQSPMRKAQLRVPAATGEAGEVVFFHFGSGSGGVTEANINRWFNQFVGTREDMKARTEEAKAGNNKVTYVLAEGTYLSGMPGTPPTSKPDFALLGAIIEDADGNVFARLTGPKAVVASATADFKKMISAAKR